MTLGKRISVALGSLCIAAVAFFYGCYVPFRERGRQVQTCSTMQVMRTLLEDFQKSNGAYPESLSQAADRSDLRPDVREFYGRPVDGWGHAIHYEVGSDGYLLISYGRDSTADGPDYWVVRSENTNLNGESPEYWRVCKDSRVDIVASDKSFHRCCGK